MPARRLERGVAAHTEWPLPRHVRALVQDGVGARAPHPRVRVEARPAAGVRLWQRALRLHRVLPPLAAHRRSHVRIFDCQRKRVRLVCGCGLILNLLYYHSTSMFEVMYGNYLATLYFTCTEHRNVRTVYTLQTIPAPVPLSSLTRSSCSGAS